MPETLPAPLVLPSGETIALRDAEPEELADFTDRLRQLEEALADARGHLEREWIRRLDRRGKWTLRVAGFEVTAPSPEAGTTDYDVDALAAELDLLVAEDVIDRELAAEALERKLTVTFVLEEEHELQTLIEAAKKDHRVKKAEPARTPKAGAIARVEKVGDAAKEAIARARRERPGPARRPKVKRVGD
jgi:hypothetical protein